MSLVYLALNLESRIPSIKANFPGCAKARHFESLVVNSSVGYEMARIDVVPFKQIFKWLRRLLQWWYLDLA